MEYRRNGKKRWYSLLLAVCLTLSLTACSSGAAATTQESTVPAVETTAAATTATAAPTEAATTAESVKADVPEKSDALAEPMSRPVRVASICLAPGYSTEPDAILAEIDRVGANGVDLVVTPEVWTGETAEPDGEDYTSPVLDRAKEAAKKYSTYLVVCMGRYASDKESQAARDADTDGVWKDVKRFKYNSCFLIDREGKIVYIYDKVYPYPPEFNTADGVEMNFKEMTEAPMQEEATLPGTHAGIYDCDFGRLGLAICFDMNFPELWRQMAIEGAELVVWPSAYSGGRNASARAAANNYYIVSCTGIGKGDCRVVDVNGDELIVQYPEAGAVTNTVEVTLNLDRTVFHNNFNDGKIEQILKDYPGKVEVDKSLYYEEEWMILWTTSDGLTVKDLCEEYGLVPLREFKTTAVGDYVDGLRGGHIYWNE